MIGNRTQTDGAYSYIHLPLLDLRAITPVLLLDADHARNEHTEVAVVLVALVPRQVITAMQQTGVDCSAVVVQKDAHAVLPPSITEKVFTQVCGLLSTKFRCVT